MRQVTVQPPPPPQPAPRVEVVDGRDQVWLSIRPVNGKFVCEGHAVHFLFRCPFSQMDLAATDLDVAVVEARMRVADELYRLAAEIDCPFRRPANAARVSAEPLGPDPRLNRLPEAA